MPDTRATSAAIAEALAVYGDLSKLILRAQGAARNPALPQPIKDVLESFIRYSDDTLADCNVSAAIDRWDDGAAARDAGAVAYAREIAKDPTVARAAMAAE